MRKRLKCKKQASQRKRLSQEIAKEVNKLGELTKITSIDIFHTLITTTTKNIKLLNPLHPNISMHILHTVLYTFPEELKRRICLTMKRYFIVGDHV